ncbi:unnamed protein product [Penicillium camemberti]|uniref:Str. FM013 n=1 Tax=Penicillium camemberti (strain FM 013) TaxID=1429867 RepID=A0A0G4PXA8_PENC3|nr:unnamed protein product [Penicillium camemberti]
MTRSALTSTTISEVQSQLWQGANQFIPRFNSSAQYNKIAQSEFPTGCAEIDGAFYVDYTNVTTDPNGIVYTRGIQACMPRDLTTSPWKSTRDRQDFTEEVYLNVTLIHYNVNKLNQDQQNSTFYKVTLDTTAGHFELPNYMNVFAVNIVEPETINGDEEHTIGDKRRDLNTANDRTLPLEVVANKDPLLTIAMALFGDTSFIQSRQAHPQAYASVIDSNVPMEQVPTYAGSCVDLAPLGILLAGTSGEDNSTNGLNYCITNTDGGVNGTDVNTEIAQWLSNFNYDQELWMQNSVSPTEKSLQVNFDLGTDTQIPVISRGGIIFVSILLGLYILMLIPLAVYAAWTPRWTAQLDSFAMMRIGAAISDNLPLTVGQNKNTIRSLDEVPG